jgi:hypothetical protein
MSFEKYTKNINSTQAFIPGESSAGSRSPKYKRQGSLYGYSGYYPKTEAEEQEDHALTSPNEKYVIRGYTGSFLLLLGQ